MLPVAKIIISGLTSIGAGMIASKLTKPLVSNANGIAKILLWFGSVGTGVAASAIVAREVELQLSLIHIFTRGPLLEGEVRSIISSIYSPGHRRRMHSGIDHRGESYSVL